MARVVVIATSPLEQDVLDGIVGTDDELHVVVAAVEQSRLQWLANDEGEAREQAAVVGSDIADSASVDASSVDVKPDRPAQLVLDAIREHSPDRVVVALRDGEDSAWLEEDEFGDVPTEIDGTPVTRIAV